MKRFMHLMPVWRFPIQLAVIGALIMLAINGHNEQAMAADTPVIGWIEIQAAPGHSDHIVIRGRVQALEAVAGSYQLRVTRTARGNKSANAQRGKFRAKAGEARALSSTEININPNDKLEITLTLFLGKEEIVVASVRTP